MKPQELWDMVEEEVAAKKPQQIKMIKDTIKNLCTSQVLVHRHTANFAEHLATLCDMVSLPITLKVMNTMLRLVVAVEIPEVDEMMKQAEAKVEAIRKAKETTQGTSPIDEVIFAQNCPTYNAEWAHSKEGKPMAYLASVVCRYIDKLMRKDKQLVLSAQALETIYHTPSSSVGKLILGKHYLGGYKLDQVRAKKEKDSTEILQRKKHKIALKSTSQPLTSAMIHE